MDDDISRIIERFDLKPHPEGGFFKEVYRSGLRLEHPRVPAGWAAQRCAGSLIYFLLGPDDFSAFHRVKWTDEIWHFYAGGPLELHELDDAGAHHRHILSSDFSIGAPTHTIKAGHWQAARPAPQTAWALAGCTVSPGFEFADFEMPSRASLIAEHARHASIITELTRR